MVNNPSAASQTVPVPHSSSEPVVVNADRYFSTFQLACQSDSPKIKVTALDCLQVSMISTIYLLMCYIENSKVHCFVAAPIHSVV